MKNKKFGYVEPADYFPRSIRKECKIGEFWEPEEIDNVAKPVQKKPSKKTSNKK